MWLFLVALAVGVAVGAGLPITVPAYYGSYLAVGLVAALDTVLGGARASLEGRFHLAIFVSGFLMNSLLAVALTYAGNVMGVGLYDAALFALGFRIFQNLGAIRRSLLFRIQDKGVSSAGRE